MTPAPSVGCPECGTPNPRRARNCRQCGAWLRPDQQPPERVTRKLLRRTDFVEAARVNQRNTRRLIFLLVLVGATLGYLVGWQLHAYQQLSHDPGASVWFASSWGLSAALIMLCVSGIWTAIALTKGDRIVMRMTGARAVSADEERQLHNVVEEMAIAAGLPKPKVYVIETQALNAFATGMSPAAASVAVTRGLLETLSRDELQGVIGHEMGHIVNWDIRYATAVSVMVGLILLVSDGVLRSLYVSGRASRRGGDRQSAGAIAIVAIVFAILAPLVAKLVQMAISRQREFLADATSVRLTRNAQGLVAALDKLAQSSVPFKGANRATQHLFIVNPLRNFSEGASALLATHPPLERRIARLRNLGE